MYKIGELKDQHTLEELKQSLIQKGITFQITQEQQNEIYVISVDNPHDVEKAQEVFNTLMGIAREFEIPPEYEKIHSIELTVLTKNLIILCFVLYGFSFSGPGKELFSFLSLSSNPNLFLSEIRDDCVGEPPGELMINATAGHFLSAKSLLINFSNEFRVKPERNIPAWPITPESLRVGILTDLENNDFSIITIIKSYTIEKVFSIN